MQVVLPQSMSLASVKICLKNMSKPNEQDPEKSPGAKNPLLPNAISMPDLLIQDSDSVFRQMLHDLTSLCGRMDQVRSKFAKRLGISGPQYNVFLYVAENQGEEGITVSKVADGLLVTGAYVTKEVNQLIAQDFLTKSPNPDDGRSVLLQVSDYGANALTELSPALQNVHDQMFQSLDQERFLALSKTVQAMLKDAEKMAKKVSYYLDD